MWTDPNAKNLTLNMVIFIVGLIAGGGTGTWNTAMKTYCVSGDSKSKGPLGLRRSPRPLPSPSRGRRPFSPG